MKEYKIKASLYIRTNEEPPLNKMYDFVLKKMQENQCMVFDVNVKVLNKKKENQEVNDDGFRNI